MKTYDPIPSQDFCVRALPFVKWLVGLLLVIQYSSAFSQVSELGEMNSDSGALSGPSQRLESNNQVANTSTATSSTTVGWSHGDFSKPNELTPVEISDFHRGHLGNTVAIVKTANLDDATLDFRKNSQTGAVEANFNKKPEQAAMIDAFQLTNKAHEYFSKHLGIETLNQPIPLNLVVNSKKVKCTAQYEEGHIYFSAQDKTCNNAVDPSTVFHEYTHYVDSLIEGMSEPDLAEGLADMTAAFMTGKPELTEVRNHQIKIIRTAANTIKYDYKKINTTDVKTQYRQSQAWSGFAWDARKALIEKYGPEKGQLMAEDLFFAPLTSNVKTIPAAVDTVFTQLNPGGSSKSTDYELIKASAERHGFRVP